MKHGYMYIFFLPAWFTFSFFVLFFPLVPSLPVSRSHTGTYLPVSQNEHNSEINNAPKTNNNAIATIEMGGEFHI